MFLIVNIPGICERAGLLLVFFNLFRNSKVREQLLSVMDQDVSWSQISVDYSLCMTKSQSLTNVHDVCVDLFFSKVFYWC